VETDKGRSDDSCVCTDRGIRADESSILAGLHRYWWLVYLEWPIGGNMEITTALSLFAAIVIVVVCPIIGLIMIIKAICNLADGGTRKADAQSVAQQARVDRA